jgi:hypothetical protein
MKLQGKWRIIETALWDKAYLDLCGPAFIQMDANGNAEMQYGAMTASLDIGYTQTGIDFEWNGADEGDQVDGTGWAELQDDGALIGEISYRNGDETTFKAIPWPTSSTPC